MPLSSRAGRHVDTSRDSALVESGNRWWARVVQFSWEYFPYFSCLGENPVCFCPRKGLFFSHFQVMLLTWPEDMLSGQADPSYFNLRQHLAVVPRHPFRGPARQLLDVALQLVRRSRRYARSDGAVVIGEDFRRVTPQ
jgi:hypothetical protein